MKLQLPNEFSIERLSTNLEWNDLVLNKTTMDKVKEIEKRLKHNESMLKNWKIKTDFKSGFVVFFYGPSGTGKTLTAGLLGKYARQEVYKIKLSSFISNYIGETEKNLSKLFQKASDQNWILFFDEADALFGKRTNIEDSHDKYANQETNYLMQRIENYSGLVIFSAHVKVEIDEAFVRRFHSVVLFEVPNEHERLKLWRTYLPRKIRIDENLRLDELAKKYELTGGGVYNVIHNTYLKSLNEKLNYLRKKDVLEAIKGEYEKDGKTLIL